MIIGMGIDLVEITRIEGMRKRWGDRFLRRIFTPIEVSYCLGHARPAAHLSGRFAMKEAVLKAFGMGLQMGVQWNDIETVNQPQGQPTVKLTGALADWARECAVSHIFASLSHERDYAIAQVILEG